MKKITREYEIFEFKELSKEAKEKVLEENRDINVEGEWYRFDIEEMIENLDEMGFEDAEIFFTGFYSQGDGASFKAQIKANRLCKFFKIKQKYSTLLNTYEITGIISRSGNYCHSNTMNIELDFEMNNNNISDARQSLLDDMSDKFQDEVLEIAKEEAEKIYKGLQESYEYLTSEDVIIETIEANEYTFLKDGTIFNE